MAPLLNINDIKHILPHRYPFLLVDRVDEFEPGKRLVARKNVTSNEPFFVGHFPAAPVMPGVLIIEALAQAAGLLVAYDRPTSPDEYLLFAGIDNVRFRIPVVPGDVLTLTVEAKRIRRQSAHLKGTATVDGKLAVEADLLAVLSVIPSTDDVAARWRAGRTFDEALEAED